MAIMPKFVLKRARPERVVAKRALLVSWWLILSTTGGSVTFARRASSSSSSQLSFRLRGPRLEGRNRIKIRIHAPSGQSSSYPDPKSPST